MPLGTEVDLSPGHIVLDGDPAPPRERGTAAPSFWPMSTVVENAGTVSGGSDVTKICGWDMRR